MYGSRPSGSGVGTPQHSCVMASSSRYHGGGLEVSLGGRAWVVARWAVLGRVDPSPRSSGSLGSRRALHVRTGDPHFASTRTSPGVLLALGICTRYPCPPEARGLRHRPIEMRHGGRAATIGKVCVECSVTEGYSPLNVLLALECFIHARNAQTTYAQPHMVERGTQLAGLGGKYSTEGG